MICFVWRGHTVLAVDLILRNETVGSEDAEPCLTLPYVTVNVMLTSNEIVVEDTTKNPKTLPEINLVHLVFKDLSY